MLQILDVESKAKPVTIYRLRVEQLVEHEYESAWYEFYPTKEAMEQGRKEIEERNKRPDGSWIPNINYMEFEEEAMSLEDAKSDMTISQFEALYKVKVEDLL